MQAVLLLLLFVVASVASVHAEGWPWSTQLRRSAGRVIAVSSSPSPGGGVGGGASLRSPGVVRILSRMGLNYNIQVTVNNCNFSVILDTGSATFALSALSDYPQYPYLDTTHLSPLMTKANTPLHITGVYGNRVESGESAQCPTSTPEPEGSCWTGEVYTTAVCVAGVCQPNTIVGISAQQNLFFDLAITQGILGLAWPALAQPCVNTDNIMCLTSVVTQKLFGAVGPSMFALQLCPNGLGSFVLGDVYDMKSLYSGSFVTASVIPQPGSNPPTLSYWCVQIVDFGVAGKSAGAASLVSPAGTPQMIHAIDSGAPIIFLPPAAWTGLMALLQSLHFAPALFEASSTHCVLCIPGVMNCPGGAAWQQSIDFFLSAPSGGSAKVSIPIASLFQQATCNASTGFLFTGLLAQGSPTVVILGNPLLQRYYTVFNANPQSPTISFASINCSNIPGNQDWSGYLPVTQDSTDWTNRIIIGVSVTAAVLFVAGLFVVLVKMMRKRRRSRALLMTQTAAAETDTESFIFASSELRRAYEEENM